VPPKNDPNSPLVLMLGHFERHWSARAASYFLEFLTKEYKFVVGTVIALLGAVIAFMKL
jgi:hypothetical protein